MREHRVDMPNLPKWEEKSLETVCEIISRGTAPTYVDSSSIRVIGQRCIQKWGFDAQAARFQDKRASRTLKAQPGDVLLNSTGTGTIGRSCVFNEGADFVVDSHVTVLRVKPSQVDPRWVNEILRSHWGQQHLECHCFTGSTNQIELSRPDLESTKIPIPPLPEQLRILETLDSSYMQMEAIRKTITKQNSIGQALLQELIPAHPIPEDPKGGWELVRLGEVVPSADYGISTPLFLDTPGTPTLRMNNLESGRPKLHEIKVSIEPVPGHLMLQYGDVLFNRTNSIEHVGRTAMWRCELDHATFASYLVRLNTDQSKIVPEYLVRWLNHPSIQQRIRRIATPGVHQVNINPTNLRKVLIELPKDISHQNEIISILEECDQIIQKKQIELKMQELLKEGLMNDLLTGKIHFPHES